MLTLETIKFQSGKLVIISNRQSKSTNEYSHRNMEFPSQRSRNWFLSRKYARQQKKIIRSEHTHAVAVHYFPELFFPSVELGQIVIGIPKVVASYRVYPVSEIGR